MSYFLTSERFAVFVWLRERQMLTSRDPAAVSVSGCSAAEAGKGKPQPSFAATERPAASAIAAIEARGRGKQDIANLRKDHDHLAEKVGEVKAEVKSNGDNIVQLTEGQGEIKGNLDALLVFIKTDSAKGAAVKSADETVGV